MFGGAVIAERMPAGLSGSGGGMRPVPFIVRLSAGAILAVTAAACGGGSPGTAPRTSHTSGSSPGSAPTQITTRDQTWAEASHQGNLAEVAAGRAAERRGHTRQVRNAGRMLVHDHRRLDDALTNAAGAVTEAMPTQPSAAQRRVAKKLAGEHGRAFDKAFVSSQIHAHKKAIALTEKEAADGRSWKLRALARAALPILNRHLNRLRQIHGG